MIESLLFLGELVLMGAFLFQVFKSEKSKAKNLDGFFAYKDVFKKKKAADTRVRRPGA